MTNAEQISKMLAFSRKEREDFKKLTPAKRKATAIKNLKAVGILNKHGKLAAAFA